MFIPGEQGLPLEVACPSCTSIIDGMDGAFRHLLDRIDVAIVAKAPLEQFTRGRGSAAGGSRRSTRRPAAASTATTTPSGRTARSSRSPTSSRAAADGSTIAGAAS